MVSLLWCSSNQGCKVVVMPLAFKRLFGGTEPSAKGFPLVGPQGEAHMHPTGMRCEASAQQKFIRGFLSQ